MLVAIKILAKALLEQQKYGQLSPETVKRLEYMSRLRTNEDRGLMEFKDD
jgi:hypothetical protein